MIRLRLWMLTGDRWGSEEVHMATRGKVAKRW
jgi:hypothetical protein